MLLLCGLFLQFVCDLWWAVGAVCLLLFALAHTHGKSRDGQEKIDILGEQKKKRKRVEVFLLLQLKKIFQKLFFLSHFSLFTGDVCSCWGCKMAAKNRMESPAKATKSTCLKSRVSYFCDFRQKAQWR